jgi:high-affinity nickel-transport protein
VIATAAVAGQAFSLGLVITVFGLGFRHGIDWDHIAAITDITSSQEDRRHAIFFGTLYALGHALVVLGLGLIAILIGAHLPSWIDEWMPRIVGFTLIVLGVYVFAGLIKHGKEFRLRSRWMLIFAGVRNGTRWIREKAGRPLGGGGEFESPILTIEEAEAGASEISRRHHGHHGHPGHHHHATPEDDPFINYSKWTAFFVGMIHGIGAETPTQILVISGIVVAGGKAIGLIMLLTFLVGLLSSNTVITTGSAFGYMKATANWKIYATVAVVTGTFSLVVGIIFLFGKSTFLPSILGG